MKKNKKFVKKDDVVDVRQSMEKIPVFFQWFLTWLTGKPLEGQQPLIVRTGISHIVSAYAFFFGGIAIALSCYSYELWLFLPICWLFTVSGARKLITTINHYCVHKDFLPASLRKKFGKLHPYIADFNSSILFLQSYKDYQKEHLIHHKEKIVASIIDPDMVFMWQLGFKAGMKKVDLWKVYIYNLLIPFSRLHRLFLISRLKSTFFKGNPLRSGVQILILFSLCWLSLATSFFTVFWVYIFPMTYLYHIAALMQFSSEHLWLNSVEENGLLNTKDNHKVLMNRAKRITSARFCGEAFPKPVNNLVYSTFNIAWWVCKMIFIYLPIRLFVLPGDLVVHDWHHRCGYGADWPNAFYARQLAIYNLKEGQPAFTEVWGIKNAINLVFESLSQMTPIYPDKSEIEEDAVLGM